MSGELLSTGDAGGYGCDAVTDTLGLLTVSAHVLTAEAVLAVLGVLVTITVIVTGHA